MANGKTIQEVRTLLEDETAISTKTGLRLTLTMLAELYDMVRENDDRVSQVEQKMEARILLLEKKSFGAWVSRNPKWAIVIAIVFTALFVSDFRQPLIDYVFGLSYLP